MDKNLKSPVWGRYFLITSIGIWILISFLPILNPAQKTEAEFGIEEISELAIAQDNSLLPISDPSGPEPRVARKISMIITAYSSTPWQTDDDPNITASGKWVREGIIANNLLPFGTKVRMPEIYGDKIFVVEDRMHQRKGYYHIDIWFSSYQEAKNFGAKITNVEILEG